MLHLASVSAATSDCSPGSRTLPQPSKGSVVIKASPGRDDPVKTTRVREAVPADRSWHVSALRQELIARNSSYAALNFLPHVTSYGELPAVVYQRSECGRDHGQAGLVLNTLIKT
jgi:hypothetical protein